MTTAKPKAKLSYVELFVLVFVLGILATIIAPTLSQAKAESRLSEMVKGLQLLRSQIRLFEMQHDGLLPGQSQCGGRIDPKKFINDLTTRDEVSGYGPYLSEIPVNPFVKGECGSEIRFIYDYDEQPVVYSGYGWAMNVESGSLFACHDQFHLDY